MLTQSIGSCKQLILNSVCLYCKVTGPSMAELMDNLVDFLHENWSVSRLMMLIM